MKSIEEYTQAGKDIYQGLTVGMEGLFSDDSRELIPVRFKLEHEVEKVEIEAIDGSRGFPMIYVREFLGNLVDGIEIFVGGAYQTEFLDREVDILSAAVLLPARRDAAKEAMGQAVWSMRNGHHLLRTFGVDSVELHNYDAVYKEKEARDVEERLHTSYISLSNFINAKRSVGAR